MYDIAHVYDIASTHRLTFHLGIQSDYSPKYVVTQRTVSLDINTAHHQCAHGRFRRR